MSNETQSDPMRELHTLLVQAMAKKLKSGEEIKASYLDTVRKFLLDNDVRVENPDEYMGHLQAMVGGDEGVSKIDMLDPEDINHPSNYMKKWEQDLEEHRSQRSAETATNDGYGFQRRG